MWLTSLVVSLGIAGAAVYLYLFPTYSTPASVGNVPPLHPKTTPAPAGRSSAAAVYSAIGVPTRLELPVLAVDAPVIPEGLAPDHTLAIPDNPQVLGWWRYGAAPNEAEGTVVIAGHVDTAAAGAGALFHLSSVNLGSMVTLDTTAGPVEYRIVARQTYLKAYLPENVFARNGSPRLVIITCGGPFNWTTHHYADNVVAYAVPAGHENDNYKKASLGTTVVRIGGSESLAVALERGVTAGAGGAQLILAGVPTNRAIPSALVRSPVDIAFVDEDEVVGVRSLDPCMRRSCSLLRAPGTYTMAVVAPRGKLSGVRTGAPVTLSAAAS